MNNKDRQAYGILAMVAAEQPLHTAEVPARGFDMNIGRHLRVADALTLVLDDKGRAAYELTRDGRKEMKRLGKEILKEYAR